MGQIQVLEAKRKQILDGRSLLSTQATWIVREEEQSRQRVTKLQTALEEADTALRDAVAKRLAYEAELGTPMRQQLTEAEVLSLEELTRGLEHEKHSLMETSQARQKVRIISHVSRMIVVTLNQASTERNQLEIELTENLRRRREELRGKLDDLEGDAGSGVLQTCEMELRNNEL